MRKLRRPGKEGGLSILQLFTILSIIIKPNNQLDYTQSKSTVGKNACWKIRFKRNI